MNSDKPIVTDETRIRPEKSEVMKLICNAEKAAALVGWQPNYSLEQGLTEVIDFVTQHQNLFKPNQYTL